MAVRSDGTYYLRVPRNTRRNVKFRLWLLRKCRKDPQFRGVVMEMCRRDVVFWINAFVWQFNPNSIGDFSKEVGPFVTAPFQDDLIRTIIDCIRERKDLVVEKSREMGASWLCLIVMAWFFLFHPHQQFICISRNEKAVDSPSKNSLFYKLDYILKRLPEWMAEIGEGKINRRVMSFINEGNGSEIVGDATTKEATVGGRATAIFVDEYAKIKADWKILTHTASTSGCRIFNSTHEGTNTAFYDLCRQSQEGADHIRRFVMHWSHHPDKNAGSYEYDRVTQRVKYHDPGYKYGSRFHPITDGSPTGGPYPGLRSPWYDDQCKKITTQRGIAADLDINPSGSTEQVFDPLMIGELIARYATPPKEADFVFDKQAAKPERLYFQKGGAMKLWLPYLSADGKPPPGPYCIGADVATGIGTTPTCLTVGNAKTGEKVLEYVDSRIEPKELAYLMVALGWLFFDPLSDRPAKIGWEIPGPGNTVTKHVIALQYPNLFFRRTEHRMNQQLSDAPGWSNSPESMKQLIENYKDALKSRQFLNHSEWALKECSAFVFHEDGYVYHTGWKDPKDPSAARINHGDRVIADGICWKLIDEWGRLSNPARDERYDFAPVAVGMPPHQYDPRSVAGRRNIAGLQSSQAHRSIRPR